MPLTAAERQKRYREKLKTANPERFEEQKKKNRERTLRQYRNKLASYNEEQKEELGRKWREERKKKENAPSTSQQHTMKNPTHSITDTQKLYKLQRRIEQKFRKENLQLQQKINSMMKGFKSIQRKVQRQQKEIESMNKKYENIMMKLESNDTRAKDKKEGESAEYYESNKEMDETPNKRVTDYINHTLPNIETPKKEEIKKKLIEHELLQESFKNEYKISNMAEKGVLKRVVNSDIIKKYKKTTKFKVKLGLQTSAYRKLKDCQKKKVQLQKQIATFFKRDDVSRATAGKKEYKTLNKIKFQKRYLLDKLKNLHRKYEQEVGRVSFSTFKKYRPFYVLPPNIKDCESCACSKHSNMQFIIDRLNAFGILKSNNIDDVISEFVCETKSKSCMYGDCSHCSVKEIDNCDLDPNTQVKWFKWALTDYEYGKEGNMKKSKKMMKILNEGTLKDLLEVFNKEIKPFKKHYFNFYYQYKQYKLCAEKLEEYEALIHIDFSENYVCKYHQEIQAKHFVKEQITLHTGVLYLKNQKPISFSSISPDNTHNPESIWAHLDPILNYIKNNHPNVKNIHFFSDGPATQYRQKKNFYLFSRNIYDYGFSTSSWSYFEAAHGKGAADGVGGAIKRTLDMKTAQGQDIPDAKTAYDVLSATETKIKIFYVPAENIKPLDPLIAENLTPIPGTMKIHQLITCGQYKIKYRDLSCFCKDIRETCACHSPTFHDFSKVVQSKRNRKRKNSSENNGDNAEKLKKKVKRQRKQSSSSSEDDTDMEIEYAESDCDDDFLSDVSMIPDPNLQTEESECDKKLDINCGTIEKCINPNKKIHILSTVIMKTPFQSSNVSKSQVGDKNQNMQTKENIEQEKYCHRKTTLINKENETNPVDLVTNNSVKICTINNNYIQRKEINKIAKTQPDSNMNKVEEEKIETVDEYETINLSCSKLNKTSEKKTKTKDEKKKTENKAEESKTETDGSELKNTDSKKSEAKDEKKKTETKYEKKKTRTDGCELKNTNEKNTSMKSEENRIKIKDEKNKTETKDEKNKTETKDEENNTQMEDDETNTEKTDRKNKMEINNCKVNDTDEKIIETKDQEKKTGPDSCELKNTDEKNSETKYKDNKTGTDGWKLNNIDEKRAETKDEENETKHDGYELENTDEKKTETNDEENQTVTLDDFEKNNESVQEILQVDTSVIVRYYERKKWKYYVGFITDIIDTNNEVSYKVRFLKTVKNPYLKFAVTKKLDVDIVPSVSVVKQINLIYLEQSKQYVIKDDFDNVYF